MVVGYTKGPLPTGPKVARRQLSPELTCSPPPQLATNPLLISTAALGRAMGPSFQFRWYRHVSAFACQMVGREREREREQVATYLICIQLYLPLTAKLTATPQANLKVVGCIIE